MVDLSSLGTVQKDGSILLSNKNINYREEMTGDYQRIRQTPDQNYELSELGYQPVNNSSFISAVGVFDRDLRIRFHNGSVYEYYGFANHFDGIMKANSKGQYFNRNIRPTKQYAKIANIDFGGGNVKTLTDEALFDGLELQTLTEMLKTLGGQTMFTSIINISGIEYVRYSIGEIIFYRPFIKSLN